MKHRNPVAVFILSIITFGIYDLYWLVNTKEVLNKQTKFHVPSIWLLILPVPMVIAGYVLLFSSGNFGQTQSTSISNYGTTTTSTSTSQVAHPGQLLASFGLIFIGFILGFIISAFWFYRYSKAVNEYTKGKMSTAVSFLILWLIHLIGVALIQDAFNDVQVEPGAPNNLPPNNPVVNSQTNQPMQPPPTTNVNPVVSQPIQPTQATMPNQPAQPQPSPNVINPENQQ